MSTATHAQLAAEITAKVPSGTPSVLTALSLRGYLNDQIDSLNVAASVITSVNLSPYQPFMNTASITANAVVMQIYDGSVGVTWGQLNSVAHTVALIAGGTVAATGGISTGSGVSAVGVMTAQNATVTASTASQAMAMGTAGPSIYFATGQPTVSTAVVGSLCLSTGGSGPSTRVWVAGSTGNWIGIVAEA